MRVSVITWNVHKCFGGVDRRYDPERVIEVLKHHQADILMLQEVDQGTPRSRMHDQAQLLADALGLGHVAFSVNHKLRRGGYGNAILSRWPLADVHNIDLTIPPKKKRGGLSARCRVRIGKRTRTVMLYNLHLGLAGFERGMQLRRFFASHPFQRLHDRTPVILGGDFNDLWGTLGPKLLEPEGFLRVGKRRNTYPAVFPVRPLDGIFVRGDVRRLRCLPSRLKIATEASDHVPLIAELEITPAKRRARKLAPQHKTR